MPKAKYRSAIRSRKLILAALADLLQEKPLEKITVTDVVNRAGINRGTFYAHYDDIPDVINHLIQQTFADIREAISIQPQPLTNISRSILLKIQSLLEGDLEFYKKIMRSSASAMMTDQLVEVVLDYMMQNEAAFSRNNHEQFALAIRFCAGGTSTLYRDWFAGRLDLTLDELTAQAEALMLGIVATLKPAQD